MKAPRLLLAFSVLGAVVTGGAVTGTTLARWRDQAALAPGSVGTGAMSFAVAGPGSAALPVLGDMSKDVPRAVELEIGNSSPADARNLRMTVRPAGFRSSNSAMSLSLEVRRLGSGEQCSPSLSGFVAFTAAAWPAGGPALAGPLAPGATARACLRVTVLGATGGDRSTDVTLDFQAAQDQP